MDLPMFCDSLSAMGPPCGPFHLKKCRTHCNPLLCSSHHPHPLPYINACSVDKNYLKWREIWLAMHSREDSLIDLE